MHYYLLYKSGFINVHGSFMDEFRCERIEACDMFFKIFWYRHSCIRVFFVIIGGHLCVSLLNALEYFVDERVFTTDRCYNAWTLLIFYIPRDFLVVLLFLFFVGIVIYIFSDLLFLLLCCSALLCCWEFRLKNILQTDEPSHLPMLLELLAVKITTNKTNYQSKYNQLKTRTLTWWWIGQKDFCRSKLNKPIPYGKPTDRNQAVAWVKTCLTYENRTTLKFHIKQIVSI
jgi:hypothetical protein